MRAKGVPIVSVGQKKHEGSRTFEMYAIEGEHQTKRQQIVFLPDGSVRDVFV